MCHKSFGSRGQGSPQQFLDYARQEGKGKEKRTKEKWWKIEKGKK